MAFAQRIGYQRIAKRMVLGCKMQHFSLQYAGFCKAKCSILQSNNVHIENSGRGKRLAAELEAICKVNILFAIITGSNGFIWHKSSNFA